MSDSGPAVASASKAMEGITLTSSTSTPVPGPAAELVPPTSLPGADAIMGDGTMMAVEEPGLPSDACETLYIQNLNETVKIDGTYRLSSLTTRLPVLRFLS